MTKLYTIKLVNKSLENDPQIDEDMAKAVRKASLNLEMRHHALLNLMQPIGPIYEVSLSCDNEKIFKNPGHRLRGIAIQLQKINKNKYQTLKYQTRLLIISAKEDK